MIEDNYFVRSLVILLFNMYIYIGPVEGSCEHGIEPSGSMKYWGVPEGLHN
jgi:hypothetical protein